MKRWSNWLLRGGSFIALTAARIVCFFCWYPIIKVFFAQMRGACAKYVLIFSTSILVKGEAFYIV